MVDHNVTFTTISDPDSRIQKQKGVADMPKFVPEALRAAAAIYEERNKLYGDNYKRHGDLADVLFPKGLTLMTADDHARFGVLTMMLSKITRYCANFEKGGHADSLDDLCVYSMMLQELDKNGRD